MKIIADLEKELGEDLDERRILVVNLFMIATLVNQEQQKEALYRAIIPAVYAQYEGFIKKCFRILVEKINENRVNIEKLPRALRHNLLLCSLPQEFGKDGSAKLSLSKAVSAMNDLADDNIEILTSLVDLKPDRFTSSNLQPKHIKQWMQELGIDTTGLDGFEAALQDLVRKRHAFAHGELMRILPENEAVFKRNYCEIPLEAMDFVFNKILDFAAVIANSKELQK